MKIYIVDAFTDRPFAGNPAAVCILDQMPDDVWMQNVASEMNLSETAFLYKEHGGYSLRWFTPKVEINLCGHATLASAHILWETGAEDSTKKLRFYTRSGALTAIKKDDWIEMNFPSEPEEPCDPPELLSHALDVDMLYVGKNRFDYLVEVANEGIVRSLKPDFSLLEKIGARGVLVTSRADNAQYDFVSRCFFPAEGIPEDPVTGSAHCCLAPYWKRKLHKDHFNAAQLSARGGSLRVTIDGNRILLLGQAITVMRGSLV